MQEAIDDLHSGMSRSRVLPRLLAQTQEAGEKEKKDQQRHMHQEVRNYSIKEALEKLEPKLKGLPYGEQAQILPSLAPGTLIGTVTL